ncbi:MAG: hypothetical protein KKC79_08740 [Gammaproteobacteria bacterium]|nr:hypothetical protein [Gammaproteobacteria bacterium]MBU1442034.1 hypothetical protein [Gammaproteobacteria bacterium]MBU2287489.1 hypothetical protein [Gammaproteobacteria bacterium]MBU2408721.1 hypothetical protein [Gammaproteobacteria bacterium]
MSAVNPVHAAVPPSQVFTRRATLSAAGYLFLSVFLIIIFEGAIRKWVSSATTLPLILMRDLLALGLVVYAWKNGHLRRYKKISVIMLAWSCLVMGWGLFQLVIGQSTPVVFIIGLRFWLLYTWFAVAAAASMNEADYRAAIRTAAGVMVLLAPLAIVQHFSPPGARINTQLDGDEESVFVAVVGVVRTTGTFSFTAGYATFLTMIAPIVFGVLGARKRNNLQFVFAVAVFISFVMGSLVSGSRTAAIASSMMLVAYLVGRLLFSKMRNKPAAFVAVVVALALTALFAFVFREAIEVTQTRFEQASAAENFGERVMTVLFGEPWVYDIMSWIGYGVGYGSNLATYVRTGSADVFALAEAEGGRILMEGGLLGFAYLALKMVVIGVGAFWSLRVSIKTNSPYAALLWLTTALAVVSWPALGNLTANGLLGIMLAFALLVFRHPRLEIFPPRASRT